MLPVFPTTDGGIIRKRLQPCQDVVFIRSISSFPKCGDIISQDRLPLASPYMYEAFFGGQPGAYALKVSARLRRVRHEGRSKLCTAFLA